MIESCPDACQKDFEHLKETDERLAKENADQWDKINTATQCAKEALNEAAARVRPGHALTALGILVAVMLAGFKIIHSQNTTLRTEFGVVKERIVAVETKLDMFQYQRDEAIRALQIPSNKDGN